MTYVGSSSYLLSISGFVSAEEVKINSDIDFVIKEGTAFKLVSNTEMKLETQAMNAVNLSLDTESSRFDIYSMPKRSKLVISGNLNLLDESDELYLKDSNELDKGDRIPSVKIDRFDSEIFTILQSNSTFITSSKLVYEKYFPDLKSDEIIIHKDSNLFNLSLDNLDRINYNYLPERTKSSSSTKYLIMEEGIRLGKLFNDFSSRIWNDYRKPGFPKYDYIKIKGFNFKDLTNYVNSELKLVGITKKSIGLSYTELLDEGIRLLINHGNLTRLIWNSERLDKFPRHKSLEKIFLDEGKSWSVFKSEVLERTKNNHIIIRKSLTYNKLMINFNLNDRKIVILDDINIYEKLQTAVLI